MDSPPVNGLGYATRIALVDGLQTANADPKVNAIVVRGSGKAFSGGADIREFGTPQAWMEPNLLSLIRYVEQSKKPVIAAIHAVVMGGGLELALGCHYRVCARGTQVALPEVKLGLLPGAGGTQRLPRAIGLQHALNMIVSGSTVMSERFAGTRLFDRIVDGDPLPAALALAEEVVANGSRKPLVRDLNVQEPHAEAYLQFARNAVQSSSKGYPAPMNCLEAVAASVKLPFDEGLKRERALFLELMATEESRALRHLFFAERAASKIPDIGGEVQPRSVRKVALVGAGTMGGGITMNFVNVGIPVVLLETGQPALDKGVATIRGNYENSARKGKLKTEQVQERMGLIHPTLDYADLKDCDMVIEAVFEDMSVKEDVFRKLDTVMKPGAILATNTSTLDVDRIAGFTSRPADVIGTHFFSPANVMRLLEVVRGKHTATDVLATTMQLARTIGKTAVVSGVCDGFIGNRMVEQYSRQGLLLLEEGCTPDQVDKALESWGMAMGPFRMGDLAGNDVGWYIRKRRYQERPDMKYPRIADKLCELGRFGQKTGKGWYQYAPGKRDAVPDPVVNELILKHREELGVHARRIGKDEIVQRLVYALVNEGARILEEGIALRASDIDMVYVTGYGFPPYRGGPMCFADGVGLYNVVQAIRGFAANPHAAPEFWTPAPLLSRLAREGKGFSG
jgi:3-hydroxyacyl-CoA dehydrogenase